MRLVVLDLSYMPADMQPHMISFGARICEWLGPFLPEASLEVVDITGGAAVPGVDGFDGFLISGSEQGVYDTPPWMDALRGLLVDIRRENKPVFGICFGHQLMADTYGGKAGLADVGEARGSRDFQIEGQKVPAHVWHRDQVTEVPPGATVTATADYCPVAGLAYDFPALSTQFHPEYSAAYLKEFISRGRGEILSDADTDLFEAEIDRAEVDETLMAREVAAFFRANLT